MVGMRAFGERLINKERVMFLNNPYTQNTNSVNKKVIKIIVVVFSIVLCIALVVFANYKHSPKGDEYKITEAARKVTPDAKARNIVVADGFAMATVYVPKGQGQLGAGNTTIFKVNKDGTMTQLANASYFSPIDLLVYGIPLETQAKLSKIDVSDVKKDLANTCGYDEEIDSPGLYGFDGSFNPDGWQIDPSSMDGINSALNSFIASSNTDKEYGNKVICINTTIKDSNIDTDKTTFVSTFILKLQFITGNGVIINHKFTFTDGPVNSRVYTLDGQKIEN